MSDTSSSVTAKQAQQKQWMKQWYQANKEYCREQAQLYYFSHYPEIKERNNASTKAYYWKNWDKILAKRHALVCSTKVYPRNSVRTVYVGCSPPIEEREDPFHLDLSW